jgi:hypothetical protein
MKPPISRRLTTLFALFGYTIFSLLAVGALLELGCWIGMSAYHRIRHGSHSAGVPAPLASEPWAREFWRQESARRKFLRTFVPFRAWGAEAWHSAFVNNDDSDLGVVRRTINPASKTCTQETTRNIWMFGGSALYGTGVPDWGTLPSYLATALNSTGRECVLVTNFGVEGYVTNQEVIALAACAI